MFHSIIKPCRVFLIATIFPRITDTNIDAKYTPKIRLVYLTISHKIVFWLSICRENLQKSELSECCGSCTPVSTEMDSGEPDKFVMQTAFHVRAHLQRFRKTKLWLRPGVIRRLAHSTGGRGKLMRQISGHGWVVNASVGRMPGQRLRRCPGIRPTPARHPPRGERDDSCSPGCEM